MLLTVRNDLRIEREKRNVSPFYEVRIPYDAEILSGGNICREAFMAKHREFWKNKDPQLSMSGVSLPPLPSDGGIWYFVDINKKV